MKLGVCIVDILQLHFLTSFCLYFSHYLSLLWVYNFVVLTYMAMVALIYLSDLVNMMTKFVSICHI